MDKERICTECDRKYDPDDCGDNYLDAPYFYGRVSGEWCLACALGEGPKDFPELYPQKEQQT